MKKWYAIPLSALIFFLISCGNNSNGNDTDDTPPPPATPSIAYSITGTSPHDTSFFTEGLEFYNGILLESTGLKKQSRLVKFDPASGKSLKTIALPDDFFGEGITVLRDTLYQLTYQENKVFVYSAKDFSKIREMTLMGEGWGLTNDGKSLIASNGSSDIYYYDPSNFKVQRSISVKENGNMVASINELEYVNGFIYANVWQTDYILKIDPADGNVVARMNFGPQAERERAQNSRAEVLNGIAYNPANKKFYLTGKNWSQIFQVQFDH